MPIEPIVAAAPEIDHRRVAELIERQKRLLAERTPRSGEYYEAFARDLMGR
jgi:hypothetical protein